MIQFFSKVNFLLKSPLTKGRSDLLQNGETYGTTFSPGDKYVGRLENIPFEYEIMAI